MTTPTPPVSASGGAATPDPSARPDTGDSPATGASPARAELTAALRGEYAAIYAYGPIGAHLAGAGVLLARAAEAEHRTRRDALLQRIADAGEQPPAAAAAYALPYPITSAVTAMRLAIDIEERCGALWRAAVRATTAADRKTCLAALTDCALRATRWRRAAGTTPTTVAFPGAPD